MFLSLEEFQQLSPMGLGAVFEQGRARANEYLCDPEIIQMLRRNPFQGVLMMRLLYRVFLAISIARSS